MKTLSRYTLLSAILLAATFTGKAQTLQSINLRVSDYKASIRSIEIMCDSILLRIDTNGRINIRSEVHGNIEYYTSFDGEYRQGKLKTLGTAALDYYDGFANDKNTGKLKSINNISITYCDQFSSSDKNVGKVKSIGNINFTYNESYNGFDNIGKLSGIGDTKITYYDRFDGGDNIGKLKSIGNTQLAWTDRFDGRQNIGKLKSLKGDTPNLNIITTEQF
ncbi:hypothetical protein BEL04_15710 [Mucilaginibacter sp. PPCGB 2223]|uniref:hypothetical protein n=1 Tax=Mucilaginibacter sp. PPCGB 2223 TaxID=1886027 RepID=UPI000825EE85|nr:hypothetical protein [Mucilaginibacter sp. PPCGB 2223]OCX51472.1 hypothetical protein BEL04_15710 [Mucilaginibacter sp. PPCGB 2223]